MPSQVLNLLCYNLETFFTIKPWDLIPCHFIILRFYYTNPVERFPLPFLCYTQGESPRIVCWDWVSIHRIRRVPTLKASGTEFWCWGSPCKTRHMAVSAAFAHGRGSERVPGAQGPSRVSDEWAWSSVRDPASPQWRTLHISSFQLVWFYVMSTIYK